MMFLFEARRHGAVAVGKAGWNPIARKSRLFGERFGERRSLTLLNCKFNEFPNGPSIPV
ncbi:hypothetical protein [uncultured Rhodoblastus sp.]|uniref:hypothetical protein n=1 Tax=uncultured Rhodoblastus sp. TaxID=543037 RepID=UPI0025E2C407|nr:hypothetical protein [uncultured Rhodoblastus sp.]